MNIVLFEKEEINKPLSRSDSRGKHITEILKFSIKDSFDAGIINGPKGKCHITDINDSFIHFIFREDRLNYNQVHPVVLITSFARPSESKKILKNVTSIGVKAICFVKTEKCEKSYMNSSLWKDSSYRDYLIDGAVQAFETDIPELYFFNSLRECLENSTVSLSEEKAALDNYEYTEKLSRISFSKGFSSTAAIAVGGERGWSSSERELFRKSGFTLCSLGKRVLKTETACIAGITLVKAVKGII